MRLVHLMPTFGIGGTELRVVSIINGLGSDFQHTIIPLNGSHAASDRLLASSKAEIVCPPRGKGSSIFSVNLYRALRSQNPDLVLTYNWGAIEGVLAARAGHICPVIHNECGFGPDEASQLKTRRVFARRILLNTIPMTIVVSAALEQVALRNYCIRRDRVRFIRTGVDCQRFLPQRNDALRARVGAAETDLILGYVGGLRSEKNPQHLVRAFSQARIPGSRLILVGDGPLRPELQGLASDLGISGKVTFVGAVDDTAPWYSAMDVFLMSSLTEQTPNALLEAMASGLPAVCTAVGDIPNILSVAPPQTIVPTNDLNALVRGMQFVAEGPELRTSLGQMNRERCIALYSRARMLHEYRNAYLSVISRRSSSAPTAHTTC